MIDGCVFEKMIGKADGSPPDLRLRNVDPGQLRAVDSPHVGERDPEEFGYAERACALRVAGP
jgi:hypothetical protein